MPSRIFFQTLIFAISGMNKEPMMSGIADRTSKHLTFFKIMKVYIYIYTFIYIYTLMKFVFTCVTF